MLTCPSLASSVGTSKMSLTMPCYAHCGMRPKSWPLSTAGRPFAGGLAACGFHEDRFECVCRAVVAFVEDGCVP